MSYPLLSNEEATAILDFLADVTIVDLTQAVKQSAIQLRKQHRFKLPDALIVATACSLNATLLTNDVKLLNIKEVLTQQLLINF